MSSPPPVTRWPTGWDGAPSKPLVDPRAYVRRCLIRRERMRAALGATAQIMGMRKAQRLSRRYLDSHSAKVAVLARARERVDLDLSQATTEVCAALITEAAKVGPWGGDSGRARRLLKTEWKKAQWVYDLTVVQRASAELVLDVTRALSPAHANLFSASGGLPALEAWLREHLPAADLVLTTDIPRFYEHLQRSKLEIGLPLSGSVLRKVLYSVKDEARDLPIHPLKMGTNSDAAEVSSKGDGVPRGSAASAGVGEVAISDILQSINEAAPAAHAAAFGDNLIVLLAKEDEQSVRSALSGAVTEWCGVAVIAELTRRIHCDKPAKPFSFCGRIYRVAGGKLKAAIDEERVNRASLKFSMHLEAAMASGEDWRFAHLRRRVRGWVTHNAAFPDVVSEAVELLVHIDKMSPSPPPLPTSQWLPPDPLGPPPWVDNSSPKAKAG